MGEPTEGTWIVVTTFPSGDVAYYGENAHGQGRTPYRGNAYRFWTENEALGSGYHAKSLRLIGDFHVEEIRRPRFKTPDDTPGD